MGFVMVHTDASMHPKMFEAGLPAFPLFVWGMCYLSQHGGIVIPQVALDRNADKFINPEKHAVGLVRAGLWGKTPDGYMILNWLKCYIAHDRATQELRKTRRYHTWRRSVLQRDDYHCCVCGSSDNLHAHHIKPWAIFSAPRFDIENGITLCDQCHYDEHARLRNEAASYVG